MKCKSPSGIARARHPSQSERANAAGTPISGGRRRDGTSPRGPATPLPPTSPANADDGNRHSENTKEKAKAPAGSRSSTSYNPQLATKKPRPLPASLLPSEEEQVLAGRSTSTSTEEREQSPVRSPVLASKKRRSEIEIVYGGGGRQDGRSKKRPWTADELDALQEGMKALGCSWARIARRHGPEPTGTGRLYSRMLGKPSKDIQVMLKDKARTEKDRRIRLGIPLGVFAHASNVSGPRERPRRDDSSDGGSACTNSKAFKNERKTKIKKSPADDEEIENDDDEEEEEEELPLQRPRHTQQQTQPQAIVPQYPIMPTMTTNLDNEPFIYELMDPYL